MRCFPAVAFTWPTRPTDDHIEHLLADIDECAPTAVEPTDDGVRVFFLTAAARDDAARIAGAADPSASCEAIDVPDDGWPECSQASLTPITVGAVTIAPPWAVDAARREAAPGGLVVVIQPSMGFGTGHHASTRLCVHWLQHIAIGGRTVLDLGTGSGVLAIVARTLGAAGVLGVDVDPDALQSARENLELNGLTALVALREVDVTREPIDRAFDVILANLTGAMLIRAADRIAALAAPDARLVASGFQVEEEDDVTGGLAAAGWRLERRAEEDGWVGAVFAIRRP